MLKMVFKCNKNLNKTKVLIFNKPGKHVDCAVYLNGQQIESVKCYKYLGITFVSSGKLTQCKYELYKKSMKACFGLQQSLASSNPSVTILMHL